MEQHHRGVGWTLLQKIKILGQLWNQRERKHTITEGPMSVQHSSAMFITKNRPTTRIISINSWLWQPRIAHVMTNLAGTGMQIRWFKPNHWVSSVSEAHRLMFLSISCLICCWSLANVVFSILQQKNGNHSMAGNLPSPIRSASSLRSARRNDHTRCF